MNPRPTNPTSGQKEASALRDDVVKSIADLNLRYREKLEYIKKLLLNESDKLHYLKSKNLEKIIEVLGADKEIIEEIDSIDCEISLIENELARIIGSERNEIFSYLDTDANEIKEINSIRKNIRDALELLYDNRKLFMERMTAESLQLQESIDEISRIAKLKSRDLE
jgi:hypothetical protein